MGWERGEGRGESWEQDDTDLVEGEELDIAVDDGGAPLVVDTIPPVFPRE